MLEDHLDRVHGRCLPVWKTVSEGAEGRSTGTRADDRAGFDRQHPCTEAHVFMHRAGMDGARAQEKVDLGSPRHTEVGQRKR